jgi:oxygen-independent coproporphyrinogen-3 oxidase
MAGLYIHIPFCRKACIYCNFHFSLQHHHVEEMVAAILTEMDQKANFFAGKQLETVYFGGGTPSILAPESIDKIISKAATLFGIEPGVEITLEANPEDLSTTNLAAWKASGVNRLSIGVQSLNDNELAIMNRNHDAEKARNCVALALHSGISSVNVDLIFGSPWLDDHQWETNMTWAFGSGADHISAYALTVEPKTMLNRKVQNKQLPDVDDQRQARQYEMLFDTAQKQGWDFYEISNLSKPGKRAVHNSNYWKNKPYLGLGPSAHSFSGVQRSWNVADNKKYMESIASGLPVGEAEILTPKDRSNEYLMTHLRLAEGLDLDEMTRLEFPVQAQFSEILSGWVDRKLAIRNGNRYALTLSGRLLCDTLTADIML